MIVETIKQKDDKRIIHLALSLAKLLEKRPPPTFADETPAAGWCEAVDHITVELVKALGRADGITVALNSFNDLIEHEPEARLITSAPIEANVWLVLIEWAKGASQQLNSATKRLEAIQQATGKTQQRMIELETENKHRAETIKALRTKLSKYDLPATTSHSEVDGVRIVDAGD